MAILALVLAACGGAAERVPPATNAAQAYAQTLRGDEPRAAWGLLSTDARQQITYEQFAAAWRSSAAERERQAQQIEEGLKGRPTVSQRAAVTYRDGKTVRLETSGDRWLLETGLVSRTVAHSPLDAVDMFARAVDGRDLQAVLSVLTKRRREGINRFLAEFAESLRKHKGEEGITFQGRNRAELKWDEGGTRYKIILVREGDEWRVDDFDIIPAAAPSP